MNGHTSRVLPLRLPILIAAWSVPCVLLAGSVSLPLEDIANGEPVSASAMRDRFEAIEAAVNDNDARVNSLEATPRIARYAMSSNQLFGAPGLLRMNFDTVDIDPDGLVETGSAWCFEVPDGGDGVYSVTTSMTVADSGIGFAAPFEVTFYVGDELRSRHTTFIDTGFAYPSVAHSDLVSLASGDCLNVRAGHGAGAQRSTTATPEENYVSIVRVR